MKLVSVMMNMYLTVDITVWISSFTRSFTVPAVSN